MDTSASGPAASGEQVAPRSHRLVRRLAAVYGIGALLVLALLLAGLLPAGAAPRLRALAHEVMVGGSASIALAALLLAFTALLGTLALTTARIRHAVASSATSGGSVWHRLLADPGRAARIGQAIVAPIGAVLLYLAVRLFWPSDTAAVDSTDASVATAFIFALAFVALITERLMAEFPEPQLPEAPSLRRLLLLTTLILGATACVELGRAAMLEWVRFAGYVLAIVPLIVSLELAVRALARLFVPNPAAEKARAVTNSIIAGLLTGGPREPATLLRTHLGLDFARSWALSYLSKAILPAILGTALLCWGLTGLKLIELGQRGIYERFGAPVDVLGPGLHLILPWPLGRLRPVEFGTIHSVAIGVDQMSSDSSGAVGAEDLPPASLNRLWETAHAGQASYLIASLGTGQQGFQSVSTEISVLYRVGLSDEAALQSLYSVADPESLIREAGSRAVLRYFNSRTLDAVLGARRENVAASLRDALAADLNAHRAGIEIVSVLIEEIHPPAGAAAAYHAVQAAEINASASISNERGRAKRVAGVAEQEAHQLTAAADALASERLHAADADSYRFGAERRAHAEGGQSFLLERSFTRLEAALARKQLILVDHRLTPAQAPILDLRRSDSEGATTSGNAEGTREDPNAPEFSTPARGRGQGAARTSIIPELEPTN